MSTHALTDSATMLRRNLRRMRRYPSMTVMLVGQPIVFLLLFVYVFGGTMGAGIDRAAGGGRRDYLDFILPGILVIAVASVALGTAVSVAMDMTEGIIARFRTMAIARVSVLSGHVAGAMLQTALTLAAVLGVAVLLGYRSIAGPAGWLVVAALLAALAFALTWLTVAMGLASNTVETASNLPMFLVFLPFIGSGFVPTSSLPVGLRSFAEYQPFTPVMDTLRTLLGGGHPGSQAVVAFAWCAAICLAGYLWARHLYNR